MGQIEEMSRPINNSLQQTFTHNSHEERLPATSAVGAEASREEIIHAGQLFDRASSYANLEEEVTINTELRRAIGNFTAEVRF